MKFQASRHEITNFKSYFKCNHQFYNEIIHAVFMTFFMILFICVFNNLSHDFSSNILKHLKIIGDIAYKIYTVPYTFPYFNFMLKNGRYLSTTYV